MADADILEALKGQRIETPSWGYGDSGTRFKTFAWPGAARNVHEKIDDAAEVHRLTGICPSVALHIPWDNVGDKEWHWVALANYALNRNVEIGAINPNLFQDPDYRLGSIAHPDARVREKAMAHLLKCVQIMRWTESKELSLWFADGTNYAGQDDFRLRKKRVREALKGVHDALPDDARMLVEYKFFEPAFYFTDLFDWGAALVQCQAAGPKAKVLVDLGHHAQGVNIEAIVAFLLDEDRLGGFHFNARRYADDDLIVGTTNPFELFCIYVETATSPDVAYMIDQSHNIEPKVEAMLQSVLNCQEAYAKALQVDRARLRDAQARGDVLEAHRTLADAFRTDVRPVLEELRRANGLPLDPIKAHRASGYQEKVAAERGTATAGGGYPT